MKRLSVIIFFCIVLNRCSTFNIKTDKFDGSTIIEYTTSGSAEGDISALHFLESKFQKKILKDGNVKFLKLYLHMIGHARGSLSIEPEITFRINGQDKKLKITNLDYIKERTDRIKGDEVSEGVSFLKANGEVDISEIQSELLKANTILVRLVREGNSAVFSYSDGKIVNIKKLIKEVGQSKE